MLRVATLLAATAAAVKTLKFPADGYQLKAAGADDGELKNCTYSQIYEIMTDSAAFQDCLENKGCGQPQWDNDDDNDRRRLADDDQSYLDMYKCYCNSCSKYLTRLQGACNACDAPNYRNACDENNNEGGCEEGMEDFAFEENCIQGGFLIANHQDTFCSMIKNSKSCLKEMEYMMNPPAEEEDDNNNNNRRRLNDNNNEQEQVAVEDIMNCWASALIGGETYTTLTSCSQTCMLYGNTTYDYMYNGQEDPVQSCGIAIQEVDLSSDTTDLLPNPVQHAGVACVSSSCSADDAETIMTYVNLMGAYSRFLLFDMEGQDNNNNNNNKDDQNQMWGVEIGIPSTKVNWRCTGDAGEGAIATDDFPEDDSSSSCDQEENNEDNGGSHGSNGNEARWATAATFAIVFALGMGVFACLYLHYYRQVIKLRKGGAHAPLANNQPPAQANVGYQGVTA